MDLHFFRTNYWSSLVTFIGVMFIRFFVIYITLSWYMCLKEQILFLIFRLILADKLLLLGHWTDGTTSETMADYHWNQTCGYHLAYS